MARIGFCGTMSVGKSTLVNALKESPEFKDYHFATERSKYLRDMGIPLNTDSTLKGQIMFLSERTSELFYENMITDRTIIDIMAFTSLAKSISIPIKKEYIELSSNLLIEYDYIFYIPPSGVEIEDNGVRTTDATYRKEIDDVIKNLLFINENKIKNLIFIPPNLSTVERVKFIKNSIYL
jgi:deoxyadenosine/deoxycytidine kinase